MIVGAADDRFSLARGMLSAAQLLASQADSLVRRSAASRAYYAAYHAARATLFEVTGRDEDDHEKLRRAMTSISEESWSVSESLAELRRLRNEVDYSPYPGPNVTSEYTEQEFDLQVRGALDEAARLVEMLEAHVRDRRRR
jgi:uncharacterized protein (UPF0332 family)